MSSDFIVYTKNMSRWSLRAGVILGAFAAGALSSLEGCAESLGKALPHARQSTRTELAASASAPVPYQAFLTPNCLAGGNFCKFFSDLVPANRRLEVYRVACQGWTTTLPSFVATASLATDAGISVQRIDFLEVHSTAANGGSVWDVSGRR